METFGYIILSILILLLMVLIHEFGHYTAAKILGFTVDEFSVGFGPKLLSRRRKNGERFSLRLLPLGGYCAFYGESDDDEPKSDKKTNTENFAEKKDGEKLTQNDVAAPDGSTDIPENCDVAAPQTTATAPERIEETKNGDGSQSLQKADEDLLSYVMRTKPLDEAQGNEKSASPVSIEQKQIRLDKFGNPAKTYNEQKPWKRIIVLLGGVLFNFISAFIFSLIYLWVVGYSVPQVVYVYPEFGGDEQATYCALQKNDVILAVNGEYITVLNTYDDIMEKYSDLKEGDTITYTVDRGGATVEVPLVKQTIKYTVENDDGTEKIETYVGFGFRSSTTFVGNNAGTAFTYCVPYTFKLSWAILGSFGQLFTGQVPITSVSGPIGSVSLMAELSALDPRNILILLPLLASNLAIFNLLPFPALDGAHIVFTVIEWIRKKPINRKVEGWIHTIGMGVLLLFVLVVDILSFAL